VSCVYPTSSLRASIVAVHNHKKTRITTTGSAGSALPPHSLPKGPPIVDEPDTMTPYTYSPLRGGEVRLLILRPIAASGRVSCNIVHRRLSERPHFDALSYCWGSSGKTEVIFCESKMIRVTLSLFSALRSLAFDHGERCIWADAICINQDDEEEKNQQVSMMGKIYMSAEKTVIWLGPEREIEAAVEAATHRVQRTNSRLSRQGVNENPRDTILAIAPIFNSPWFHRLWVVQEVALAKECEMAAGQKRIMIDQLHGVISSIPRLYQHQDVFNERAMVNLSGMMELRDYRRSPDQPPPSYFLLDMLQKTEWFQVTETKDRVYALLGLAGAADRFRPNYDPGYSHEAMFIDFAIWALSEFPHMALLSFTRGTDTLLPGPSWAPGYPMSGLPISLLHVRHISAWSTASTVDAEYSVADGGEYSFEHEGNTLCLAGVFVDTVKHVFHGVLNTADPDQRRQELDRAREFAHRHASQGNPTQDIGRDLAAALILELSPSWQNATDRFIDAVEQYIEGRVTSSEDSEGLDGLLDTWPRFRNFSVTSSGRFAWIPERASPGRDCEGRPNDRICVFRGGRVPYVVRGRPDGSYGLVGECWIQGLMQGEWAQRQGVEVEKIRLV
jgi:hypothetical protein